MKNFKAAPTKKSKKESSSSDSSSDEEAKPSPKKKAKIVQKAASSSDNSSSDDDNLDEENKNFLNTLKRKADEVIATNELKKKNKTKATSISNGTNGFHSIDSDNSQETIVPVAIVVPKKRGPNVRQFFLMFKFINFLKFV